ncbi:uncharacterized protein LACBIDRAFT_329647 [Laccaria bicolor S238N-H82]|uniref:Predicted protein n=1 Tax=Laccaria bicolor (strain S238N-H82 / ATCC MYA-4686) TaxID=486041 RepID=B0DIP7_LACBS|nr:uncharacterized protein LACBIDRAFT_329647 [Laccaria bicolor S238N-H82]EDR05723.1 predicted protein [Laccaria bicolor S238N-H82]|eukprot:XP_001883827.1 predicted protein [Laccaria bicolor S238N-H82]
MKRPSCRKARYTSPAVSVVKIDEKVTTTELSPTAAVDNGIMRQSDTIFTNQFTRDIGKIRYMIFELYERKLMTYGGFFQEMKAVWEGLSLEINECIRDVDALEWNLEWKAVKSPVSVQNFHGISSILEYICWHPGEGHVVVTSMV